MEQEKRKLCSYDNKLYLDDDLPDGSPDLNTNAYCNRYLVTAKHLIID